MDEKLVSSLAGCMIVERKKRFQSADEWLDYLFEKKKSPIKNIIKRENNILQKGHRLVLSENCYIEIIDHFESTYGEHRYTGKYISQNSQTKCIFNEFHLENHDISKYTTEIIQIYKDYSLYPTCGSKFIEILPRPYLVDDGITGNYRIIDRDTKTIFEYLDSKNLEILTQEKIIDLTLQILEFLKKCKNGKNLIHLGLSLKSILIDDNNQIILSSPGWAKYCQLLHWNKDILTHYPNFSMVEMDINYKNGKADNLSDIYAIGIIMYRLMIGINIVIPHIEERINILASNSEDPYVEPSTSYSREFINIVMKAISINSFNRIQSAEEFIDLLENISSIDKDTNSKEKEGFFKKLFK
jgi:hypothetical protein